jgi:hypothetical protein
MKRIFIVSLFLLSFHTQADAQWTGAYGSQWNNPASAMANQLMWNSINNARVQSHFMHDGSGKSKAAPKAATPKVNYAATDFKSSGSRLMIDQFANSAENAADRKQLAKAFRETLAEYEKQVRKNNLAYAFAFFLGANLQVVLEKEISDADSEALAAEVHESFLTNEAIKKMSDKQKQQLYESWILTTAIIAGLYHQGVEANDADVKKQAQDLARHSLADFGYKLE